MIETLLKIENEINELNYNIDKLDILLNKISYCKKEAVANDYQEIAKILWCCETIVSIQRGYAFVFELFSKKEFYKAWCELAKIEIDFKFLKKHFDYSLNQCRLLSIERYIVNLQVLFPYKLFSSHESIYREKRCSICDQIISVRNPCGHKVGEIYNGEMCGRVITEADLLAISVVENPVNKYAVVFLSDGKTDGIVDHYNYSILEDFLSVINSTEKEWEMEIKHMIISHDQFDNIDIRDFCPCGSNENYKDCCLHKEGVKHVRYLVTHYNLER